MAVVETVSVGRVLEAAAASGLELWLFSVARATPKDRFLANLAAACVLGSWSTAAAAAEPVSVPPAAAVSVASVVSRLMGPIAVRASASDQ